MRVPTCRTRMLPAFTCWPAKRFVPRRWPLLSRPLRELPCPFLCAIVVPSLARFVGLALDRFDSYLGEALPVPLLAAVVLAPLALEDDELARAALPHDGADHARARHERLADARLAFAGHDQHLVERHALADGARQRL